MLDANVKTQVKAYFEKLVNPIEIVVNVVAGEKQQATDEMLALLRDIVAQTNRITLRTESRIDQRYPAFHIGRVAEETRVAFAGVPMGHEFTSLILALLQVSGYPAKVEQALLDQVRALPGEYRFETYISLSCQNCPEVVQALNLMAVVNPCIQHVMIDGAVFQEEVSARQIMAVPTVYLNGNVIGQGRMSLEEIVAKVDPGAEARRAASLANKAPYDVLVIGGGPAGAAASIYAARKGIRTGVVAERFGGQVLDTVGIENFISVKETEGPKLALALEQHVKTYDVDIMNMQRATSLVPGEMVEITLANGATLKSKTVLLATGARWREMNVPGEREYRGKGVAYCPHCDGPLFKGKRVAVIGGGNSGVEAAIDLAGIVAEVTLLEFDSQLRADAVLQKKLHSLPNVKVITSAATTEVIGDGQRVNGLGYRDRVTGALQHIELEGVFVQIGLVPNTDWLKGVVALTARGEIEVDARGQTSVPGVFAAGDVTTSPFKQIVIAMGDGAKAALGAFDHLLRSPAGTTPATTAERAA